MAPRREKTVVNMPVYAMGFATKNRLLIAGGGGSSRSGVLNAVAMYKVDPVSLRAEEAFTHKFPDGSDAIMSMSVHPKEKLIACGMNSSGDCIKAGHNKSLKIFKVGSSSLEPLKDLAVTGSTKLEDYQRVTEWSPSGTHLFAASTDGSIAIYEYPSWARVLFYQPSANAGEHHHGKSEIWDASWEPTGRHVATVSARKLVVYSASDGSIVQDIAPGEMNGKVPCDYRQCKYGMNETAGYIFLFLNTRNKKENSRAFVSKWKTSDWTQVKARAVSRSPIVSAGISQSGKLLGVAFADFSIGVIGADKLELLYQVPNAHGFAITNLVFTRETGQSKKPVLVSSSVEATIALTSIPDAQSGTSTISIILFVLLILVGIVILTVLPTQDLEKYAVAVREFVQRLADQLPPSLKAAVAKSEL